MLKIPKNTIRVFIHIVRDFLALCTSYLYRYKAIKKGLIGIEFDSFGRNLGWSLIKSHNYSLGRVLLVSAVSIVRYFELPFCHEAINWKKVTNYLDVSSPRLFFLFLVDQYPQLIVNAINPDQSDLNKTRQIIKTFRFKERIILENQNALKLDYPGEHFDAITSISVLEHIPGDGDQKAIKELWRVLKPGGKLIITVPCMKKYREEWRGEDVYGLDNSQNNGQYFFQRFYDYISLKLRLINAIGSEPRIIQVFGEKQYGIFFEYEKRWMRDGLKETAKDPWHIVNDYQMFSSVDDLPGMGVCGLVFEKEDSPNV